MHEVKCEQINKNRKIKDGVVCVIGGIFIANWYSIALYVLTKELVSTQKIISMLNEGGHVSSAMTVLLFNVFGNAFVFFGVFCLIKYMFCKIKRLLWRR